jgi:hypothetical protein
VRKICGVLPLAVQSFAAFKKKAFGGLGEVASVGPQSLAAAVASGIDSPRTVTVPPSVGPTVSSTVMSRMSRWSISAYGSLRRRSDAVTAVSADRLIS